MPRVRVERDDRVELHDAETERLCLRKRVFHKRLADMPAARRALHGIARVRNMAAAADVVRVQDVKPEYFAALVHGDAGMALRGEKRRAALAGIIAMHPKYLVLDEPMAGLDPSGRRSVLDMLVRLQKENGTGIVMVSHSMDDIARVADRVAVMNKGRLVMCDTPKIFNRSDELVKMGLDVPQAVKLADALLKRGVDLGGGLCTEDELFTRIMEITRHV